MANKAVFLDRDNTLIEDPGYLSDPSAVKLLPGVELALKSLVQAGYKLAVVTNQSGIARGLLTEEALEKIHAEMRRQLSEKDAHLDAIYYCPHHPEGTIEGYAIESELRKPKPGMLLQAAKELDLDLSQSWMVGDSPRDIEAGQRAGCRTIRVRLPAHLTTGESEDEDVQADFTVRNLVDAAKVITREAAGERAGMRSLSRPSVSETGRGAPAGPPALAPPDLPSPPAAPAPEAMGDSEVLREILTRLRRATERREEKFSFIRLFAAVCLILAVLGLLIVFWNLIQRLIELAAVWATVSVALSVLSLALYALRREE
ncbi:MAG TPA: D-glycero-beta-D-manno-heptose 1,7-bisphosphate 7-phosphatase [Phycisphaerae bacterium]|nr:D-glycero-beta-D-manno-heptose 1,7-bisphosphate 7-phosphatase [Phycisphaerae bacterium]